VSEIPAEVRAVIESGALAHLVTLNPDGSPQVSCIWVGLDGDELVSGHLNGNQRKLRNVRRDPRVSLSFEAKQGDTAGMRHYAVLRGHARLTEGGAADLLQRLAYTYIGPGVTFPPMPDPPPGFVMHIEVDRVGGFGPWAS
jgi:PPOX class probable F420-dependent enzyme